MGSEIAISGVPINGVDDIMRLANIALKSGYFGIRTPEEAAIKLMYGMEMGLPGLSSMLGVNVIQGRVTMGANLVASLVKRSGRYNYTIPTWDDRECHIHFTEGGKLIGVSSFTMADAKRAGLVRAGGNWDKYPKAMLFARAMTQGARAYCPDVFVAPVYDPEELTPEVNTEDTVKPAVEASKPKPSPAQTPPPAPVAPLKAILQERFGNDANAKMQAVALLFDTAYRNEIVTGGGGDSRSMYNALVKAMDEGKLTVGEVNLVLNGGEAGDDEEVLDVDPDAENGE